MEEREADRRAVARGLRRAFALNDDVPDRFQDLLDRIGADKGVCDITAPEEPPTLPREH